jgi:mono/diheme cytochrome c family protein
MKRLLTKLLPLVGLAGVLALALFVVGPSRKGGPEPLRPGRDACARCRMHIAQPGFGGELRDRRGVLTKYDDVGCLLQALWEKPGDIAGAWVEDHGGRGFVGLRQATLVRGSGGATLGTPMGYDVVAFADPAAAREFAHAHGAEIATFAQLSADRARFTAPRPTGSPAVAARPGKRPFTQADATAGKALYLRECSACHGDRGDGKGPAAAFVDPRPRDFTKKVFKLRTTENGQPPTSADILQTIERGIPGSAMPSFRFLTEEERRKIAAYVLDRADLLDEEEPRPIDDPGAPPPVTPSTIARGRELYEQVQCWQCHGHDGRGSGPAAAALRDDDGRPIEVRDFTGGVFRGGGERRDLYYRFVTGMDGSPMPNFKDTIQSGPDRWALVDYVMSLRQPPSPKPLPADALAAGREVAAKYSCRGCHVLDDGRGGDVGPDLRISGQKLDSEWVRTFLQSPRAWGKIYPWRIYRMPHLGLDDAEARVMARYLATMGGRKGPATTPDPASFSAASLEEGKTLFVLRCTECHTLGKVIETPVAKQQGPDLARVAHRVDFDWAKKWIADPKKIDPKTKMTVPGITASQVDSVRRFVWKTSIEAASAPGGTATR